jgi:hypothetical protein
MRLVCVAVAATVLIVPNSAFAAADETSAAPEQSVAEQVLSAAETDRVVAQDSARESGRELEALARAPSSPVKPKAVRHSKLAVARAAPAPHPSWGCSGYWCGRQFVLMLGIGY